MRITDRIMRAFRTMESPSLPVDLRILYRKVRAPRASIRRAIQVLIAAGRLQRITPGWFKLPWSF